MTLKITNTVIDGVSIIESSVRSDERGSFSRLICKNELDNILAKKQIVQMNYSLTHSIGSIRGLHLQYPPYSEMKLIRCIKGKVWDVAVDLRKDSPTFLKWHAEEISKENYKMMVVPEGCAHGFQVLEENSELYYCHTEYYNPEHEAGFRFNDPILNITWPLPVTDISERDLNHPLIQSEFSGIMI